MRQRQHFLTLDALRGVAALAVMIYHQRQARIMGHGYLAVDFFFILSGFVIAKAYERKLLTNMSFGRFVMVRAARLYPLLIAATLLAAAYTVMSAARSGGGFRALELLPAALLALPDPSRMFAPDPFPLLPVVWSLFFELAANFIYALFVTRLTTRAVVAVIAINAVLLLAALMIHGNGELGNTYSTLIAGLPRVLCSFFAGILLFRLHSAGRLTALRAPPVVLAAALLALLAVGRSVPWIYDATCIFIAFPIIVIAAKNVEPAARIAPIARFSAELSYPLYLFHLPLMHWASFGLSHFGIAMPAQELAELIVVPALAYASWLFFDRPLQNRLKAWLYGPRAPADAGPEAQAL